MRKIYTPIAVLTVGILALGGCHNPSSPPSDIHNQKIVNSLNNDIRKYTQRLEIEFDSLIKAGLAAQKLLYNWGEKVIKTYPVPKNGFTPFDHSYSVKQRLLWEDVYRFFRTWQIWPKYTDVSWGMDVVNTFEHKWEPFFKLHKDEEYFIYNPASGQDEKVVHERIQSLIDDVDHIIIAFGHVLNFDYSKFDKQWYPLITQFWRGVDKTNKDASLFKSTLVSIDQDLDSLHWG